MFENNKNIVYQEKNGIKFIQFKKLLELNIKHAYTLKNDGMNFRSDCEEEMESYRKIFSALDLDVDTRIKPIQRHTANIKCIERKVSKEELMEVDGLITNQKGLTLITTNADCILFMFYDPVKKVIANVHSGWKGTFQKIAEKAVVKMINYYKCNPKDILVFINPSIRKCHFEVYEDVKELCEYIFNFTKKTNEFIEVGEIKDGKQKYFIDTVMINKILFKELGIKEENIFDCNLCSVCNSNIINSYRVDGKENYKLGAALISL